MKGQYKVLFQKSRRKSIKYQQNKTKIASLIIQCQSDIVKSGNNKWFSIFSIFSPDIEKDYDYITGRVSKNSFGKSYSEALQNSMTVNDQNTKAFKNRPIVQGRLNGENTNVFLDTGSEINVINQSFFRKTFTRKI